MSGQALEDAVTADLQTKYGNWGFFTNFIKRNIEQTAAELSGQKKLPTRHHHILECQTHVGQAVRSSAKKFTDTL